MNVKKKEIKIKVMKYETLDNLIIWFIFGFLSGIINLIVIELRKNKLKKYKHEKYKDIKKLRGVEFNERMKLEFALRDTKNIEASDYLTMIYNRKKKNRGCALMRFELPPGALEVLRTKVSQDVPKKHGLFPV